MAQIKGIDISSYQNQVDFNKLKTELDFVIIKATESIDYVNPLFSLHRKLANEAGLALGFYHFARPEEGHTPEEEADHFINTLGNLIQGEVLYLDWEPNWGGNAGDYAVRFLNHVSAHYNGIKPLIYLNISLKNGHDWSQVINGGYGLWLADYTNNEPAHPWAVIALQQMNSSTQYPGVNGNVDADIFYGDVDTFHKYGYQAPNATPIPPVTTVTNTYIAPVDPRDQQIVDLNNKVTGLQHNVDDLNNQINSKNQEIARLTSDKLTMTNDSAKKDQEILDANNKAQACLSQLTLSQNNVENLNQKIADIQKQNDTDLLQADIDASAQIAIAKDRADKQNLGVTDNFTNIIRDLTAERDHLVDQLGHLNFLLQIHGIITDPKALEYLKAFFSQIFTNIINIFKRK